MVKQGHVNHERRSRETTATNFGNASDSATYDRLYREKQDHVFQTLRRHNFLMAPVEKLPSGNRYLLAETFRKWYGSTIFVSMEYAPLDHSTPMIVIHVIRKLRDEDKGKRVILEREGLI